MKTSKISIRQPVDTGGLATVTYALAQALQTIHEDAEKGGASINWDTIQVGTEVEWTETSFLTKAVSHSSRRVQFVVEVEASR